MKKITILFLVVCMTTFTSCLNLIEELTLNKNGSGKYTITFDMGSMFTDPMMKGMIQEAIKQQSGSVDNLFSEMDTVIYFKDAPQIKNGKIERPEFWNKVKMNMKISEATREMISTLQIDFESVEDIDYFYKNLDKLESDDSMGPSLMGSTGSFLPKGALFVLKNKQFSRLPTDRKEDLVNSEEMQFAKMLFANAKYTTIYNLPGKIKKTSIPGGKVDGKTIKAEYSFLDILEGKAKMEGDIKFK